MAIPTILGSYDNFLAQKLILFKQTTMLWLSIRTVMFHTDGKNTPAMYKIYTEHYALMLHQHQNIADGKEFFEETFQEMSFFSLTSNMLNVIHF